MWDYHILYYFKSTEEHFDHMVNKWGEVWYRYMEEKFWLGQWIRWMLFGNISFDKTKNKLPFIFFYRINGLYFNIINNVKLKFSKNENNQNNSFYQDNLCSCI